MKRLVISAAIMGSGFIFASCATNNEGQVQASNSPQPPPQVSPYAPPNNEAIYEDAGFNHWPLTFNYPINPGPDTEP
ncbi:MAG TPA: hypothetical protein VK811_05840 [Candidatus Acidoferrum sp.]|jgi:hypothetical protein|nr:hypothetical protein [Candidatus Acidoferrum sp.]